jgi:hypothetical protein
LLASDSTGRSGGVMRIQRLALAALLATIVAIGCDGTTEPSSRWNDLTGVWDFSFTAEDSTPCGPSVPPYWRGCSGGGTVRLFSSVPLKHGTWTGGGGCQDCGGAADFVGGGLEALESSPTTISFRYGDFRFDAPRPPGEVTVITGTMSYSPQNGATVHGTWSMTR